MSAFFVRQVNLSDRTSSSSTGLVPFASARDITSCAREAVVGFPKAGRPRLPKLLDPHPRGPGRGGPAVALAITIVNLAFGPVGIGHGADLLTPVLVANLGSLGRPRHRVHRAAHFGPFLPSHQYFVACPPGRRVESGSWL